MSITPSMYDPLPRIIKYILVCSSEKLEIRSELLEDTLQEFILTGLANNIKIIKALQERANKLKDDNSIRYLLYEAVIKRIERIKVPIYSMSQIEKISNMPSNIKEEISKLI